MENNPSASLNKGYVIGVSMLTFVLPVICAVVETFINRESKLSLVL